jgi:hypothetical protein
MAWRRGPHQGVYPQHSTTEEALFGREGITHRSGIIKVNLVSSEVEITVSVPS